MGGTWQAGDAALLHEDQPKQTDLTQGVLDGGAGATGERGDGVDVQGADSSPLARRRLTPKGFRSRSF